MYGAKASILAKAISLTQAQSVLKNAMNTVDNLGKNLKLNLNSSKSESIFFNLSNTELDWKRSIKIGDLF